MAKQKTVKIGNKEYTLQHPGIGFVMDLVDECKVTNENGVEIVKSSKLYKKYLEFVVVNPKMALEDFEKIDNGFKILQELIEECTRFLTE